jgi:hypothetical protein
LSPARDSVSHAAGSSPVQLCRRTMQRHIRRAPRVRQLQQPYRDSIEAHMHAEHPTTSSTPARRMADRHRLRRSLLVGVCSCALLVAGCGGGGSVYGGDSTGSVSLGINAVVAGAPAGAVFVPGTVGTIDISAGQTIELDANEPVDWAFSVDGSPLFGSGTTVYYGGLSITESAVSPSRVVLDTAVNGTYLSPITVTMTATSTIDAAEVARVNIIVH